MSNVRRKLLIAIVTLVDILFCTYVYKVVLHRDDFRAVDLITVVFAAMAILKNIQLIYLEVKHHGRK